MIDAHLEWQDYKQLRMLAERRFAKGDEDAVFLRGLADRIERGLKEAQDSVKRVNERRRQRQAKWRADTT